MLKPGDRVVVRGKAAVVAGKPFRIPPDRRNPEPWKPWDRVLVTWPGEGVQQHVDLKDVELDHRAREEMRYRRVMTKLVNRDKVDLIQLIARIHGVLDEKEWDSDTPDQVAQVLIQAGLEIGEPDGG